MSKNKGRRPRRPESSRRRWCVQGKQRRRRFRCQKHRDPVMHRVTVLLSESDLKALRDSNGQATSVTAFGRSR
jgi:hypothetical protein